VQRLKLDDSEARKFMNRLSRDNVAQIVVLEALRPVRPGVPPAARSNICIANTHLYSNVQRADVKLWQTVNLMRELQHFVSQRDVPLLLCGDLNSEPESAVYEYLMTGNSFCLRSDTVMWS
jgi:CCR4-NOT transcription complex subunit 6